MAMPYEIHTVEHASTRPLDPAHSPSVVDTLRRRLDDMAALYRLYCEEATPADLARLELDAEDITDATDAAHGAAEGWALSVDYARWSVEDGSYREHERGPLARVRFLLTFGGPNIWLEVDFSAHGDQEVRSVTLERYWGGEADRAETTDADACGLADSFVRALYAVD